MEIVCSHLSIKYFLALPIPLRPSPFVVGRLLLTKRLLLQFSSDFDQTSYI